MRESLLQAGSTFTVKKDGYTYMTLFGRVFVQVPCGTTMKSEEVELHAVICERCDKK